MQLFITITEKEHSGLFHRFKMMLQVYRDDQRTYPMKVTIKSSKIIILQRAT